MISSSSYAPGLSGLLSSIRKDDVTQRRRRGNRKNAAGTSNGRLFERRQKVNNTGGGGSSYSADRAASLQASRKRKADSKDRIESTRKKQLDTRLRLAKAEKEHLESPEQVKITNRLRRNKKRKNELFRETNEEYKEAKRIRDEERSKRYRKEFFDGLRASPY